MSVTKYLTKATYGRTGLWLSFGVKGAPAWAPQAAAHVIVTVRKQKELHTGVLPAFAF